jgi:hypothetical protein
MAPATRALPHTSASTHVVDLASCLVNQASLPHAGAMLHSVHVRAAQTASAPSCNQALTPGMPVPVCQEEVPPLTVKQSTSAQPQTQPAYVLLSPGLCSCFQSQSLNQRRLHTMLPAKSHQGLDVTAVQLRNALALRASHSLLTQQRMQG